VHISRNSETHHSPSSIYGPEIGSYPGCRRKPFNRPKRGTTEHSIRATLQAWLLGHAKAGAFFFAEAWPATPEKEGGHAPGYRPAGDGLAVSCPVNGSPPEREKNLTGMKVSPRRRGGAEQKGRVEEIGAETAELQNRES